MADYKSLRGDISEEQKAEVVAGAYWRLREVAAQLNFSTSYIRVLCQQGVIQAIRYRSRWRIPKSEVKRLLLEGLTAPPRVPKPIQIEELTVTEEQKKFIEIKKPWWQREISLPF